MDLDSDSGLELFPKWLLYSFQGWISILRTDVHPYYLHFNQGMKSESEPMEKSCIVQESVSESESGSGNKPLHM